jgi:hypothetical protein
VSLDENIFNQPIPRFSTDKPLSGCVITISGFSQLERDVVTVFCATLGAHCQQSLSMKHADTILPNTHLVCRQAAGPKYTAAKSWGLPVVCPEWLVESCVGGTRAEEQKYTIDNTPLYQRELMEAVDKIRRSCEDLSTNNGSFRRSNRFVKKKFFFKFCIKKYCFYFERF